MYHQSIFNQSSVTQSGALLFGCRLEGLRESDLEIKTAGEVSDAVAIVLSKIAGLDEIVDDVSHVFAALQAPFMEDGQGHGTIFGDGMEPVAFEDFLTADVLVFLAFAVVLHGDMQGIADEFIRQRMITRVGGDGLADGEVKREVLGHSWGEGKGRMWAANGVWQ